MNIVYELMGFLLVLLGIVGSFLPVLPGPLTGWLGLFLLHQSERIPHNTTFLATSFGIALAVFLVDYVIPGLGTKKFGGSKKGVIGSTLGLILGLLFLGPLGIIIGPFFGAYLGELMNKSDQQKAFKAALGSLIGFLTGVFLKFAVAVVFCFYFIKIYTTHLL